MFVGEILFGFKCTESWVFASPLFCVVVAEVTAWFISELKYMLEKLSFDDYYSLVLGLEIDFLRGGATLRI